MPEDWGVSRYWASNPSSIPEWLDGFPIIREGEYRTRQHIYRLEELHQVRCLVLLGEAGAGKTTEVARSVDAGNSASFAGFESQQALVDWLVARRGQTILLDGFDEWAVSSPCSKFEMAITRAQLKDTRILITCRSGVWPSKLFAFLKGELGYAQQVQLVQLQRQDVIAAALAEGISDPDEFCREILRRGVVGLACRPITLRELIATWKSHGELPQSRASIYESLCHRLCGEMPGSVGNKRPATLSASRRLELASRLAAISQLVGASLLVTGETKETGELNVQDVLTDLTQQQIEEVLGDTALFNRNGHGIWWARATYGEFLAARHISSLRPTAEKLRSFVFHPEFRTRISPTHSGLTAWLAEMDSRLRNEVMANDPEVLLNADCSAFDEKFREQLVGALLNATPGLVSANWHRSETVIRLNHPRLANQLQPWIEDTARPELARRWAVNIGATCCSGLLANSFARVVRNRSERIPFREIAARQLSGAPIEVRQSLLPELFFIHQGRGVLIVLRNCRDLGGTVELVPTERRVEPGCHRNRRRRRSFQSAHNARAAPGRTSRTSRIR